MPNLKDDCFQSTNGHCFCIEFHTGKQCRGFHSSHLIEYTFEETPDAKSDDAAGDQATPPERLAVAFSTADVTILGWRLGRLASLLHETKLAAVGTLPKHHAQFDPIKPFVASIVITPIAKS
jgi:hypothetical protein